MAQTSPHHAFGDLLKQCRKRAGMTQSDLAAALGYSISLVCALEQNRRLPDVDAVLQAFVPALGLQEEPHLATRLVELAAAARGERPPVSITRQRATQIIVTEEFSASPRRVPVAPTELVGREPEVRSLCSRLLGHRGRLLTLVGPPGIGKTSLALAMAERLQNGYQEGACFVALAAISDPVLMAATIAAAVGSSDSSSRPPKFKLIEFLRRKTVLLVLDNLEQIADTAPLVADLLAECPGVCILATSRERLHLRAEQRYFVPPLALEAAVELFSQRAQAVDDDFVLTTANRPTIAAICQQLDRLPLAIELCAAQIDLLSPAQLLAQLQAHRLDLLVEGALDLPPRQRTLRAAIEHSYRLLNETERTLLRSLGVFVGGFDLEAVAAVVADSLATAACPLHSILHALIGKSLVRTETTPSGEQRFQLLEMIREFALEQLRAQGEEAVLRERHFATFLQLFRTSYSHLRGPEAATWFARLQLELDNLRAALQWTLDQERYTDMAWLLLACSWHGHLRGQWDEARRWLAQLVPHRQELPVDLRLAILYNVYNAARYWEEFQPVDRWAGEMMQLLEVCSNKLLQATAWFWSAIHAADFSQAAAAWEQAIGLARAAEGEPALGAEFCILADRDFVLVSCLWDYASALIDRGQITQATPLVAESLAIFRRRENQYEIADAIGTLGRLALLQGDLAQAHRYLHEAVTIATTFNHQGMLRNWPLFLGLVTLYGGNAAEARRLLSESLRLCIELKDKIPLALVCTCLAETALWENDLEQAAQWLAQSLAHSADPHRITLYEVERLWVAARLATAQQQYQHAATLFGLAEQVHSQVHDALAGPMRALADAALTTVRAALPPTVFAEAFTLGRQLSLAQAFAPLQASGQVTTGSADPASTRGIR